MTHCKTDRCAQGGKACPTPINCGLMTQNGGEFIDTRRKTFAPDYGIEHASVHHDMTPWGWLVACVCVVSFVIGAYRFLN